MVSDIFIDVSSLREDMASPVVAHPAAITEANKIAADTAIFFTDCFVIRVLRQDYYIYKVIRFPLLKLY
jgi:predicted oxidoreductase (fatty acid repression mutant protein)